MAALISFPSPLFDKNGNILPQQVVKPNFNADEIKKYMLDYKAKMQDTNPIIVSIHPNGKARVNDATIVSNFATSLYGKDRFQRFMKSAVDDGRILYLNKKRILALAREARVQFSGALTKDRFFIDNIARFMDESQVAEVNYFNKELNKNSIKSEESINDSNIRYSKAPEGYNPKKTIEVFKLMRLQDK